MSKSKSISNCLETQFGNSMKEYIMYLDFLDFLLFYSINSIIINLINYTICSIYR